MLASRKTTVGTAARMRRPLAGITGPEKLAKAAHHTRGEAKKPAVQIKLTNFAFPDEVQADVRSGLLELPGADVMLAGCAGFKAREGSAHVDASVGFRDRTETGAVIPSVSGFHDTVVHGSGSAHVML